jgi:t-SNARE complex subunit (syntaxin)
LTVTSSFLPKWFYVIIILARKAAVESYNQNTLNEVDESLSSSAANLKKDLKEFANQSNHLNKGVKSLLNDMERRLVEVSF